jgi:hypothetical protein
VVCDFAEVIQGVVLLPLRPTAVDDARRIFTLRQLLSLAKDAPKDQQAAIYASLTMQSDEMCQAVDASVQDILIPARCSMRPNASPRRHACPGILQTA